MTTLYGESIYYQTWFNLRIPCDAQVLSYLQNVNISLWTLYCINKIHDCINTLYFIFIIKYDECVKIWKLWIKQNMWVININGRVEIIFDLWSEKIIFNKIHFRWINTRFTNILNSSTFVLKMFADQINWKLSGSVFAMNQYRR